MRPTQIRDFEMLQNELEEHMQSFDNLGISNQRVYDWHKSILKALQDDGYTMSDFYFTSHNLNNCALLQHVAFKENSYNFLNSKGLINRGFCPITGESINNSFNFNIFGRVVYLSKTGLETCENIKRREWNRGNPKIDYDTAQRLKRNVSEVKEDNNSSGWFSRFISVAFFILIILYIFKKCV